MTKEAKNNKIYLKILLWALGLAILLCLVILPTVNVDAGMTIPGPDGGDHVVEMSRPQILFFLPGDLLMRLLFISNPNLFFAVSFSLLGWTAIFFVMVLFVRRSILPARNRIRVLKNRP